MFWGGGLHQTIWEKMLQNFDFQPKHSGTFYWKKWNNSKECFTQRRLIGLDLRNTQKAQFQKELCLIKGQQPFKINLWDFAGQYLLSSQISAGCFYISLRIQKPQDEHFFLHTTIIHN